LFIANALKILTFNRYNFEICKIFDKAIKNISALNKNKGDLVVSHFNLSYSKQFYINYNTLLKSFKNIFIKNRNNTLNYVSLCFNIFKNNHNVFVYTDKNLSYEYSLFFYFSFGVYYYKKYRNLFKTQKIDKFRWKLIFSKMAVKLRISAVVVITNNIPLDLITFFKASGLVLIVHCTPAFYYPGVDFPLYVDNITFESKFILLYFLHAAHKLKIVLSYLNFYNKYLYYKLKTNTLL